MVWIATGRGKSSGLVAIHSSGQNIFSLGHIEGITLGAGEEVDKVTRVMLQYIEHIYVMSL